MSVRRGILLSGVVIAGCSAALDDHPHSGDSAEAGVVAVAVEAGAPLSPDGGAPLPGAHVTCGAATCTARVVPGVQLAFAPCCPASAPARCGVDLAPAGAMVGVALGCTELDAPGPLDAACPGYAGGGLPLSFPGCRRPDGTCGVHVAVGPALDLGCFDFQAVRAALAQRAAAVPRPAPTAAATAPPSSAAPPSHEPVPYRSVQP